MWAVAGGILIVVAVLVGGAFLFALVADPAVRQLLCWIGVVGMVVVFVAIGGGWLT